MSARIYIVQDEDKAVTAVAATAADAIVAIMSDLPGERLTACRGADLETRISMDQAIDYLRHGWEVDATDETGLSRTARLHEVIGATQVMTEMAA